MTVAIESSIVRIFSNRGNAIGAGFLVSQKYILTCAHVVADALGLPRNTVEMPDSEIALDFPLLPEKSRCKARVVLWLPVNPDRFLEDIAGLELERSAPEAALPARLIESEDFWGYPYRVLGFPAKQSNGVWASGELRAAIANGWVQLEDVKQAGYRLEPGFSGAPIWDEKLQGVLGMAVAADKDRPETKAGFMIPTKLLIQALPELGEPASLSVRKLEPPDDSSVPLDSVFYVERPPIESDCYQAIVNPGALIRVKAPWQMGKTSLMERIVHHATEEKGYQAVKVYFQEADGTVFAELEQFLKWFCTMIASELKLPNKLGDDWLDILSGKNNCTNYFHRYLLPAINSSLVLALDDVDRIFQQPAIAREFFGLLRAWHNRSQNDAIWKKLRLIIVHSNEVYLPIGINQSPFNVGLAIELPELNQTQVQDLVQRYGLSWTGEEVEKLMAMVGGHPHLLRVALYHIARGEITLEGLLENAPTEEGLYSDRLRRYLQKLRQNPKLLVAMKQVVATNAPVRIDTEEAFKLRSMGLVKMKRNDVLPLCDLYRQYFCDRLRVN